MARFGHRYRVGIDIGGTFTDFVLLDEQTGEVRLHKCLTTPDDPATGALDGLGQLLSAAGLAITDVDALVHGTTLVTNTLIERRGARVGLLTTQGFRDILESGFPIKDEKALRDLLVPDLYGASDGDARCACQASARGPQSKPHNRLWPDVKSRRGPGGR